MWQKVLLFIAAFAVAAFGFPASVKDIPIKAPQYTVKGVFSLPAAGIDEPFTITADAVNILQRVSWYNGLDEYIYDRQNKISYEIFVANNENKCIFSEIDLSDELPVPIFPDLTEFTFEGQVKCEPLRETFDCLQYKRIVKDGERNSTYYFYVKADDQTPYRYELFGYDLPFGSHYDWYRISYESFIPAIAANAFDAPEGCVPAAPQQEQRQKAVSEEFKHLMNHFTDRASVKFEEFKAKHAVKYRSHVEHSKRFATFRRNLAIIDDHNRKGTGVTLAVNHLADRTEAEIRSLRGAIRSNKDINQSKVYQPTGNPIPSFIDWRGKGAVNAVKDQAACGACWTFASAEAIESAWFLKTGELVDLSEQNLVDCSWNGGNIGCDGGNSGPAFQYVIDAGGLMLEQDYHYIGQNDYCHFNKSKVGATIVDYRTISTGDEKALADALANQGPLYIAFDASLPTFTFYSHGVYNDPQCSSTDLDHAVLLIGLGTTPEGEEYWLVQNSWSHLWGHNGYFRVARNNGNRCGVATDSSFPIV